MNLFTAQDGDMGDIATAEAVFQTLKDAKKDNNPAVVRLKNDKEFFEFTKAQNQHVQTQQGLAQMVAGTVVPVWVVANFFPDGEGWRVLLNFQPIQAQLQAAPPLGGGRGLRGLNGKG